MAESTPQPLVSDLSGIAKLADTELAKTVYKDGLKEATIESGKLTTELTKTVRLAMQPLFTSIQGAAKRLNAWIAEAFQAVPPERRVDAKPALLNSLVMAIGVEEDGSEMRQNYVKLLASLMDGDRQNDLHPAFPRLLQELSAWEALLLQIAPPDNGIVPPSGATESEIALNDQLFHTIEDWHEGDTHFQEQRFFIQGRPASVPRNFGLFTQEEWKKYEKSQHFGFLEIMLPPQRSHVAAATQWINLERLRLVKIFEKPAGDFGSLLDYLEYQPTASEHMKRLLRPEPAHSFIAYAVSRELLGQLFSRCCVPAFAGETRWHPATP